MAKLEIIAIMVYITRSRLVCVQLLCFICIAICSAENEEKNHQRFQDICGQDYIDSWISTIKSRNSQPTQVLFHCYGTLINDRHLLSSTSCSEASRNFTSFEAHFEKVPLTLELDPQGVIQVDEELVLFTLATPIDFSSTPIRPICTREPHPSLPQNASKQNCFEGFPITEKNKKDAKYYLSGIFSRCERVHYPKNILILAEGQKEHPIISDASSKCPYHIRLCGGKYVCESISGEEVVGGESSEQGGSNLSCPIFACLDQEKEIEKLSLQKAVDECQDKSSSVSYSISRVTFTHTSSQEEKEGNFIKMDQEKELGISPNTNEEKLSDTSIHFPNQKATTTSHHNRLPNEQSTTASSTTTTSSATTSSTTASSTSTATSSTSTTATSSTSTTASSTSTSTTTASSTSTSTTTTTLSSTATSTTTSLDSSSTEASSPAPTTTTATTAASDEAFDKRILYDAKKRCPATDINDGPRCFEIENGYCLEDSDNGDNITVENERFSGLCICEDGFELNEERKACHIISEDQKLVQINNTKPEERDPMSCQTTGFKFCDFPFTFEGEERYECIKFPELNKENYVRAYCITGGNKKLKHYEQCNDNCPLLSYHSHDELKKDLEVLAKRYPEDSETFSLGESKRGEELLGIRISKNLPQTEKAQRGPRFNNNEGFELRPRVKLIGNMHGNEPTGRELLIHFAKYLLFSAAAGDKLSNRILETTDLYILPTMNPDGFKRGEEGRCNGGSYSSGRLNEGRKDLNRDFPDFKEWQKWKEDKTFDLYRGRQKETKLLMQWILSGHFLLSANFHDGAVLVNYPWDNYHDRDQRTGEFHTPDHQEFYHISTSYSLHHKTMNDTEKACKQWGAFKDGITNGADWYPVYGGMQDFNYLFANTLEVTVEVSCCKFPTRSKLITEWENNKQSLLNFVQQAELPDVVIGVDKLSVG